MAEVEATSTEGNDDRFVTVTVSVVDGRGMYIGQSWIREINCPAERSRILRCNCLGGRNVCAEGKIRSLRRTVVVHVSSSIRIIEPHAEIERTLGSQPDRELLAGIQHDSGRGGIDVEETPYVAGGECDHRHKVVRRLPW